MEKVRNKENFKESLKRDNEKGDIKSWQKIILIP